MSSDRFLAYRVKGSRRVQGLAFLHEHRIILHTYGDFHGTMMDIGGVSLDKFDRTKYPVRYYRINFSRAEQLKPKVSAHFSEFHKDVQDCGATLDRMLSDVSTPSTAARVSYPIYAIVTILMESRLCRVGPESWSETQIARERDERRRVWRRG